MKNSLKNPRELLNQLGKNQLAALVLMIGFAFLFVGTVFYMGGKLPPLPAIHHQPQPEAELVPFDKIEAFFHTNTWAATLPATHDISAFYTLHFKPPAPPPTPPTTVVSNAPPAQPLPPPPPPTVKLALCYLGMMESSKGFRQAFIQVGTNLTVSATNGSIIATNFTLADFSLRTATLLRSNETNILNFKVPVEFTVPAR